MPGPWIIGKTTSNVGRIITPAAHADRPYGCSVHSGECHDKYQAPIAWVGSHVHHFSQEESEANARLIAAAPELYEALKAARTVLGEAGSAEHVKQMTDEELGKLWIAVSKQADAALAKAEAQ